MYSLAAISIPSRSFLSKSIETTIFKKFLFGILDKRSVR